MSEKHEQMAAQARLKRTPTSPRRPVIYVASPYAAETEEDILSNVRKAQATGRMLVQQGACALVPHTLGFSGIYGSPTEADFDGKTRQVALECSEALASRCDAIVLSGPSEGMSLEMLAFRKANPDHVHLETVSGGRQFLVSSRDVLLMVRCIRILEDTFFSLSQVGDS